jgi:hypothetical protein
MPAYVAMSRMLVALGHTGGGRYWWVCIGHHLRACPIVIAEMPLEALSTKIAGLLFVFVLSLHIFFFSPTK